MRQLELWLADKSGYRSIQFQFDRDNERFYCYLTHKIPCTKDYVASVAHTTKSASSHGIDMLDAFEKALDILNISLRTN